MRAPEISRATPHVYVDAPEHVRKELEIPARTERCRQPIFGGGTCLMQADSPYYHVPEGGADR